MHMVIIGAGIAGVSAAFTLRKEGYSGKITLVDADANLPYDRPPLSKEYLRGEVSERDILLRSEDEYKEKDIDLKLGVSVSQINPDNKTIILESGEIMNWDKLLLTTGSKLRRLDELDQAGFGNVYYLRRREDADRLKGALSAVDHAVVIGAGFIGLETATSLLSLGKKVTVLEAASTPLSRVLGDNIGNYMANFHRENGVDLLTDCYVTKFNGKERIESVESNDGRRIPCDAILVGIGVYPDSSLIKEKLAFDNGIIVNEYGETSVPNIYAAGDCTRWPYAVSKQLVRVEHWDHSLNHSKNAAINMMHARSKAYDTIPYFWSDQHHMTLQYVGHPTSWDQTVIRGDMDNQKFTKFYLDETKVTGALMINDPINVLPVKRLIKESVTVDSAELADESIRLRNVIKKQKLKKGC